MGDAGTPDLSRGGRSSCTCPRSTNPGLDPGPGERMLSTELIDPFANLIRFFERNVEP
jgi:hypothetical protein